MQRSVTRAAVDRLFSLNLVLLLQGQTVSRLGGAITSVALALWVLETTGSATYVGLVVMCTSLPFVLLTPLGGVITDRVPRKTVLVTADVVMGLSMLSLTVPFFVLHLDNRLALIWLVCALLLNSAAMAFFMPAIFATIPDLATRRRLDDVNSLFGVSNALTNIVGSGFAGVLFRIVGAPVLFVASGVGFLLSAASEAFLRLPSPASHGADQRADFWGETRDGLAYVWRHKGLRNLHLIFTGWNFLTAPIIVVFPILVTEFHQQSSDWLGYIFGAVGAGSMVGLALFKYVRSDGPGRLKWFTISALVPAFALCAMGATPDSQSAIGVAFIAGMAIGPTNVMFSTVVQGTVPREMVGRVASIGIVVTGAAAPLGYAFGGIVLDLLGKNAPLMLYICGASIAAVLGTVSISRDYREFMSTRISVLSTPENLG